MADAPKLVGTDRLKDAYPKINLSIEKANQAAINSDLAKMTAESVQSQLDTIIIESGTSDAETIQARTDADGVVYATVKERIDAEQEKVDSLKKKTNWISILEFDAVGDGVTDNTAAIQDAISYAVTNRSSNLEYANVYVPQGRFKYSEVTINDLHVRIFGEGTLVDGHILIGDATTTKDLYYRIENLTFDGTAITGGKHAIEIQNAKKGKILNCKFKKFDKTIYVRPKPGFQHTNRLVVSGCTFHNVNYCMYIDRDASHSADSYYTVGDIHFINNQADEGIVYTHFYGKGVDGLVMTGNTLFFPTTTDRSTTKEYNVYIDYGNFIIINGNNLFESGLDSIKLSRVMNFNITGNNIAWPSQREPGAAIRLTVGDILGGSENNGSITGNNIESVSYVGVEIEGNVGNVVINGNNFQKIGDTTKYYGSTDISGYGKWAVRSVSTTKNIFVNNNLSPNGEYQVLGTDSKFDSNVDRFKNRVRSVVTTTITAASTTSIDPNGVDQYNLNPSSSMTISSIVASYSGHEITLLAFNANTTIQNNAGIILKGGTNSTLPNTGMLRLRYTSGKWYEVSRNY
jgi:Pectate lyase superfamily protein